VRRVFVDAVFWVARTNEADDWHRLAIRHEAALDAARVPLVTTEEVLVEMLASFSRAGWRARERVVANVHDIMADPNVLVLPQSHDSFMAGLELYEQRLDKGYSLVDCISMQTMRDNGWTEALTYDQHFLQEGFRALLRE
jgi:uncharacterized protein